VSCKELHTETIGVLKQMKKHEERRNQGVRRYFQLDAYIGTEEHCEAGEWHKAQSSERSTTAQ
jgi:hypothetical protein